MLNTKKLSIFERFCSTWARQCKPFTQFFYVAIFLQHVNKVGKFGKLLHKPFKDNPSYYPPE